MAFWARGFLPKCAGLPPGETRSLSTGSDHVGDEELLAAVERTRPRVHVFGHIHRGCGTTRNEHTKFYNASLCNEAYEPIHKPWAIDLDRCSF